MRSIISSSIIKTLIILFIVHTIGSNSDSVSRPTKKQRKFTVLNNIFKRKNKQYSIVSKDGSLLFPALKAISNQNIPILKSVNNFDNNYDEDILNRNQVYIIKNGEVPGWDGMKIPIHSTNDYSKLRLKPPEESKSISIFPPVVIERFMLFTLEECLLPSKFFVQVAFCTFDAIYPYLEGVPSGEIMQDIVGAAMYSINKIEGNFSFDLDYCRNAIAMISDPRINSNADSKCHDISLCMHQDHLPQLSPSLSKLNLNQLIEKSFMLHGLEYQLRINTSVEFILWKIIKFTHKSRRWKKYRNPNRLFTIIRAYILTLYVRHSSQIIPGWYLNQFPPPKKSLSFVYVKNEHYTDQSAYINYCAKKLKCWLDIFQPITSPILPNIDTKYEVSRSACFQAGRAGFVSSEEFDFSDMIEQGTENVDLLNLQLPVILTKSDKEINYIRNNNLRRVSENRRWTSYHESYPYSFNEKAPQSSNDNNKFNLQNLAQENPPKQEYQDEDILLDEITDLVRRKNNKELNSEDAHVSDPKSKEIHSKVPLSPKEFLSRLKQDNFISNSHKEKIDGVLYNPRSIIDNQFIRRGNVYSLKRNDNENTEVEINDIQDEEEDMENGEAQQDGFENEYDSL
ncbi:uncharacterized protein cubi_03586 [Cryptosporidium ubiquitum]|uniref:Uncharacterized protein n=1 Tax=Cryptosporidium ubiquitum TaxID=857276 RepID=A0A1J4ML84_9CRYT|nr:uncharacterized protein cubi_03586 [Cryptosporidium ubiquitum]OII73788.1 hypothetical protein cubi_03586 [Cryptosporidium ubiquitum]